MAYALFRPRSLRLGVWLRPDVQANRRPCDVWVRDKPPGEKRVVASQVTVVRGKKSLGRQISIRVPRCPVVLLRNQSSPAPLGVRSRISGGSYTTQGSDRQVFFPVLTCFLARCLDDGWVGAAQTLCAFPVAVGEKGPQRHIRASPSFLSGLWPACCK